MAVEKIQATDSLNDGRVKLNAAIDQSNEAITKASTADANASLAVTTANSVQEQFNQVVIEGDSSVEAAQARVSVTGTTYQTLKERLDQEYESVTTQLAKIAIFASDLKMDGSDETQTIQSYLDYVESLGGGTLLLPKGTVVHTINFIPDNVRLKGAGLGQTTIKLKDGFITSEIRKPSGFFTKVGCRYFEITDLTYDGNASGNIDLITANNYDNYYSHGISTFNIDPTIDPYEQTIVDSPFDFLIDKVHIKNTIRNSLLVSGEGVGTVGTVTLENAYTDHFIYESDTDRKVTYENLTTKGTWRAAAIVASNGVFKNWKHREPSNNPSSNYYLENVLQVRKYINVTDKTTKPTFNNIDLELVFEELNSIIQGANSQNTNFYINHIKVKQLDSASVGMYNAPVNFLYAMGCHDVTVENVQLNNVHNINILAVRGLNDNINVNIVSINYAIDKVQTSDETIVLFENYETQPINNININGLYIKNGAPKLVRLTKKTNEGHTTVRGLYFDNVNINGSGQELVDHSGGAYFTLEDIRIANSKLNGYAPITFNKLKELGYTVKDTLVNNTYNESSTTVSMLDDWTGTISLKKNEFNQVSLETIDITVGTMTNNQVIATLPTEYNIPAGRYIVIPCYNHTKHKIISDSLVISGNDSGIKFQTNANIATGDVLRFNLLYQL